MVGSKRVPGHLYLMNDLIITTYYKDPRRKETGHVLIQTIPITDTLAVKDKPPDGFVIAGPDIFLEFWCAPQRKPLWIKELSETIQTTVLKSLLDDNVDKRVLPRRKDFEILSARYGSLTDAKQLVDLTAEIRKIVDRQGGDRLILKGEGYPKAEMFPSVANLRPKKASIRN